MSGGDSFVVVVFDLLMYVVQLTFTIKVRREILYKFMCMRIVPLIETWLVDML